MKKKLNKTAFTALEAALQALYKKVDGKDGAEETYELDLEDDDDDDGKRDDAALKAALAKERDAAKALKKELADIKKQKQEEDDDGKRKSGDVEALEKSWRKKLQDRETELNEIIEKKAAQLQKLLVDNAATELAASLSQSPSLILPHIKARLTLEEVDGEVKVRVLDKDGKPSASSLDDLKKEFFANKDFAPILVASKGSGGGSGGSGQGGGSSVGSKDFKNTDGSVNWTKVHQASKEDPTLVSRIREEYQIPE
jgi:hypothetical protein